MKNEDFERWWQTEGAYQYPNNKYLLAKTAWENGAYKEKEKREKQAQPILTSAHASAGQAAVKGEAPPRESNLTEGEK